MKRLFAMILSVILLGSFGAAHADERLFPFYDAALNLLFETDNVTLTGEAEFSLEGERFKTANLECVQDGANSLLRWELKTPRMEGNLSYDRETGYTVIANGEKVFVMEAVYPGVYKTGSSFKQNTILRDSIQMDLMKDLLRMLVRDAENLVGEKAVTVTQDDKGGQQLHLQIGGEITEEYIHEILNTFLNLAYQAMARRYFFIDYDLMRDQYMFSLSDYFTTTRGILYTTRYISLRQADLTVDLNSEGLLDRASGELSLYLYTVRDGSLRLDIPFRINTSAWGTSHVDRFDPAAYNVVLAEGYSDLSDLEEDPE